MKTRSVKRISLVLALVMLFAVLSMNALAATYYDNLKAANATVDLDGTNPGTATVSVVATAAMDIFGIEGAWDTTETEGTGYLTLTGMTSDVMTFTGMNFVNVADGKLMWTDDTFSAPAVVANGTKVLNATFNVAADAPAGTYTVRFRTDVLTPTDYTPYTTVTYYTAKVTVTRPAAHVCSGTLTTGQAATCTTDGWKDYYTCSCTKLYSDAACTTEITLDAWKTGAGKIAAGHNYGTKIEAQPEVHTPTELKAPVAAHYICSECGKYFDEAKVETTLAALTGATPEHTLTPVNKVPATCTTDGVKAYYTCSCGAFEDAAAKNHIADLEAWKTGAGKIAAGHNYGTKIAAQPAVHTPTELKAPVAAHYVCSECGKYFTEAKVETTLAALTGATPAHDFSNQYGYKGEDGHANTCECGLKDAANIAQHTPDRAEATENDPILCEDCGYMIAPELGHTHNHGTEWKSDKKNHWNECACGDKANTAKHKDADKDGFCDTCQYEVGIATNPETGDNSSIVVLVALMTLSAAGVVLAVVGKKRFAVK